MGAARESRQICVSIEAPAARVYAYASDPMHLPEWAQGLGSQVERDEDGWIVVTAGGRLRFAFAPPNEFGVLDHELRLPSGETLLVPMRVIADGDTSEVVFTLRREEGVTDEEFERDAATIAADLDLLKQVVESRTEWL